MNHLKTLTKNENDEKAQIVYQNDEKFCRFCHKIVGFQKENSYKSVRNHHGEFQSMYRYRYRISPSRRHWIDSSRMVISK